MDQIAILAQLDLTEEKKEKAAAIPAGKRRHTPRGEGPSAKRKAPEPRLKTIHAVVDPNCHSFHLA